MALIRANTSGGGGGTPTLDYDGYSAYIGSTRVSSYTISGNHDFIQLVTGGVGANTFYPSYNGTDYHWKLNASPGTSNPASVLIPNVKDGTSITFSSEIQSVGIYGLSYS